MKTIKKGDQVWIKKAWQDDGDDQYVWIATEDESKGRVGITPLGTGLTIPPYQICPTHMLEKKSEKINGKILDSVE